MSNKRSKNPLGLAPDPHYDPNDPRGLRDESGEFPWHYQCSICEDLVRPDDVRAHTEFERAKDDWQGWISWSRVDGPVKDDDHVWLPIEGRA